MEGRSLLPALENQPVHRDAPFFFEHEGSRAVRDGKWKLVSLSGDAWELYDLDADPTEMRNLAPTMPERARELAALWEAWAKRCHVEIERGPLNTASAGQSSTDVQKAAPPTPLIANRPLRIRCDVQPELRASSRRRPACFQCPDRWAVVFGESSRSSDGTVLAGSHPGKERRDEPFHLWPRGRERQSIRLDSHAAARRSQPRRGHQDCGRKLHSAKPAHGEGGERQDLDRVERYEAIGFIHGTAGPWLAMWSRADGGSSRAAQHHFRPHR